MKNPFLLSALIAGLGLILASRVQAQFTYTTNDGTITVTGYTGSGGVVTIPSTITGLLVTSIGNNAFQYSGILTRVTIGTNVTRIGDYAFQGCSSLISVTIPNSVTSIGDGAFESCSMSSVTIPKSVLSMGEVAFASSDSLTSVTLLNSVIGGYAFDNCTRLTRVTIGTNVTSIGDGAFRYCTSLTNVTIPNSVTSIGKWPFVACGSLSAITVAALNSVYSSVDGVLFNKSQTMLIQFPGGKAGTYTIPNSVTNIGDYAFVSCTSLSSVTIPNSLTSIGNYAFSGCTSLTTVMIPSSVTSIGDGPFYACGNLTSVTIGSGVTSIGNYAFAYCTSLTEITVDALNSAYSSVDGVLFGKSQTTLIKYPLGKPGNDYTIPNSVTSIENSAFDGCTSLTTVTILNSVTSMGDVVFRSCTSLIGVYFQGNSPSLGLNVFSGDDNAIVYYLPGTMGWGPAFGGLPTALWLLPNPLILTSGTSFGVRTNRFGFIISWAANNDVMVEACTNLGNPVWVPVGTNTLTDGSSYFTDSQWRNYHARFYRLRAP